MVVNNPQKCHFQIGLDTLRECYYCKQKIPKSQHNNHQTNCIQRKTKNNPTFPIAQKERSQHKTKSYYPPLPLENSIANKNQETTETQRVNDFTNNILPRSVRIHTTPQNSPIDKAITQASETSNHLEYDISTQNNNIQISEDLTNNSADTNESITYAGTKNNNGKITQYKTLISSVVPLRTDLREIHTKENISVTSITPGPVNKITDQKFTKILRNINKKIIEEKNIINEDILNAMPSINKKRLNNTLHLNNESEESPLNHSPTKSPLLLSENNEYESKVTCEECGDIVLLDDIQNHNTNCRDILFQSKKKRKYQDSTNPETELTRGIIEYELNTCFVCGLQLSTFYGKQLHVNDCRRKICELYLPNGIQQKGIFKLLDLLESCALYFTNGKRIMATDLFGDKDSNNCKDLSIDEKIEILNNKQSWEYPVRHLNCLNDICQFIRKDIISDNQDPSIWINSNILSFTNRKNIFRLMLSNPYKFTNLSYHCISDIISSCIIGRDQTILHSLSLENSSFSIISPRSIISTYLKVLPNKTQLEGIYNLCLQQLKVYGTDEIIRFPEYQQLSKEEQKIVLIETV